MGDEQYLYVPPDGRSLPGTPEAPLWPGGPAGPTATTAFSRRHLEPPDPERPPIERYVRCSVTVGGLTVEPGIEWREGDNYEVVAGDLAVIGEAIVRCGGPDPMQAARRGENAIAARWPGRAFFIEIHDTAGRWTQTYQPYGMPRFR